MSRLRKILLILICMLFLQSCVPSHSIIESDPSCELPCWRGIRMGAKYDEVLEIVENMEDVQKTSIKLTERESPSHNVKTIWFSFLAADFSSAKLYFSDDQLLQINFFDPKGKAKILSNWIDLLGEPGGVWLDGGGHTRGVLVSSFYFPNMDVCLEGKPVRLKEKIYIEEDHKIVYLVLYDPGNIPDFMDFGCYSKERILGIKEWTGYGEYLLNRSN